MCDGFLDDSAVGLAAASSRATGRTDIAAAGTLCLVATVVAQRSRAVLACLLLSRHRDSSHNLGREHNYHK